MQRGSLAESMQAVGRRCRPWRDYPHPAMEALCLRAPFLVPPPPPQESPAPGEREEALRRLEAVLFLAREPLTSRKLSQYANLADATEARTLVRQLNEGYEIRGRAFRVEEVAGGFQLLTRPSFAAWLRRLEHVPGETRLSVPALETLAVVAYRQPTPRADVEAIRGVSCGEILRQLMERDLVRIQGRSNELGRPFLYGTTMRFLQIFGLKSLDHLPRAKELKHAAAAASYHPAHSSDLEADERPEVLERSIQEDSHVTTTFDLATLDTLEQEEFGRSVIHPQNQPEAFAEEFDDDDDFEDEEEEEEEDDEDEEDEEDEEDFEEEDFEEDEDEVEDEDEYEEDDFEEEDEEEEDFDDEEWEEVDDDTDDEDWEEDEDEDEDWDDDDDDDDEDEEEEESEEEEWE
jgi:segregation and condensation protein B